MGSHDRNGARHGVGVGSRPLVPFVLGAAVGGLAGGVVGILLSGHAIHLFTALIDVVERRDDDDHPRFELLLQ